jgi:hypothetical protein
MPKLCRQTVKVAATEVMCYDGDDILASLGHETWALIGE